MHDDRDPRAPEPDPDPAADPRAAMGLAAERFAAELLSLEKGWRILAHRLRTPPGEIDLLAHDPGRDALVVVEVKARTGDSWMEGEDLLRPRQRWRLAYALEYLVWEREWCGPHRVDLCEVLFDEQGPVDLVHHFDVDC